MDIICSDIHASAKHFDEVKLGFKAITDVAEKSDDNIKRLFILGDLWDHKSYLKFGADFLDYFVGQVLPAFDTVYIMEGTPMHDYDGFAMFKYLPRVMVIDEATIWEEPNEKYLFLPQKTIVNDKIVKLYNGDKLVGENVGWSDIKDKFRYVFGHFFVQGATYGGNALPEELITERPIVYPGDLLSLDTEHIFLGHIHTPQPALDEQDIHYCGSMYAKSWGETDEKGFYCVTGDKVQRYPYGTPKRYVVTTEKEAKELREAGHYVLVKKTEKKEAQTRELAEKIFESTSVEEKIKAYAKAKGVDMTPTLEEKIKTILSGVVE